MGLLLSAMALGKALLAIFLVASVATAFPLDQEATLDNIDKDAVSLADPNEDVGSGIGAPAPPGSPPGSPNGSGDGPGSSFGGGSSSGGGSSFGGGSSSDGGPSSDEGTSSDDDSGTGELAHKDVIDAVNDFREHFDNRMDQHQQQGDNDVQLGAKSEDESESSGSSQDEGDASVKLLQADEGSDSSQD